MFNVVRTRFSDALRYEADPESFGSTVRPELPKHGFWAPSRKSRRIHFIPRMPGHPTLLELERRRRRRDMVSGGDVGASLIGLSSKKKKRRFWRRRELWRE